VIIGGDTTEVVLVNQGSFDVKAQLFIGSNPAMPRDLLTVFGEEIEETIEPGETLRVTRSCQDVQAVVIGDADLLIVGGSGPDDDTDVLRAGTDFGCGDTIVFTFDHSAAIFDFEITWQVY
jgi:hypothetical protein